MFCFVALIVFSILGIFSATHRKFAREAFDCVFRRVTLRSCSTGFREKVRGIILVKLMKRSSFFAKIFNKHFELIAWIFFILMIISTAYVAKGGYNFYLYGNCNGINEEGFCLFDPTGESSKISSLNQICGIESPTPGNIIYKNLDLDNLFYINNDSENNLVFIACYLCDYSRKAYPDIKKIIDRKKPNVYFAHLPINHGVDFMAKYDFCAQKEADKYLDFVDLMFKSKIESIHEEKYVKDLLEEAGYDSDKILQCSHDIDIELKINESIKNIESTNIYGTPLIFVNEQILVGPKPYRVLKSFLK